MRYYEFNEYGYYALIMAKGEKEAVEEYREVVANIDETEEHELSPDVVEEEYAREIFCKSLVIQGEENKTYDEFGKDFDSYKECEKASVLLIDGSLL